MAKGRARRIPPQTDTVVRFAPEHVVLFLRLCDVGSKGASQRRLRLTANIHIHSGIQCGILYLSLLFKKGGDSLMGELNLCSVGNFLATVLQGILIHIISYMVIEFFKNRK